MRKGLLALAAVSGLGSAMAAPPAETVLWPGGAPRSKGAAEADRPAVFVYRPAPALANGAAVVICPGGGYGGLAMDHEGHQVGEWLASFGVTGIVLRYRHAPHYHHPAPLEDAQRAIRWTRSNAASLGIDPKRVGIMGFSAGGHLAATAATKWDLGAPAAGDAIDRESSRPDFAILAYPVITLTTPYAHLGSRDNLLGPNASKGLVDELSAEKHVKKDTPPVFLFTTTNDDVVPVENSLMMYAALHKAGVQVEMHIFREGPHGMGLNRFAPDAKWPDLLKDWMTNLGLLKAKG